MFGDTHVSTQAADGCRRVTPAPQSADCGQTRIIPSCDVAFVDQPQQSSLAHHRMGQIQAVEFDLLRVMNAQVVAEPVVQWSTVFEFQGADAVGDSFNGI